MVYIEIRHLRSVLLQYIITLISLDMRLTEHYFEVSYGPRNHRAGEMRKASTGWKSKDPSYLRYSIKLHGRSIKPNYNRSQPAGL